jgi:hypothetical protein
MRAHPHPFKARYEVMLHTGPSVIIKSRFHKDRTIAHRRQFREALEQLGASLGKLEAFGTVDRSGWSRLVSGQDRFEAQAISEAMLRCIAKESLEEPELREDKPTSMRLSPPLCLGVHFLLSEDGYHESDRTMKIHHGFTLRLGLAMTVLDLDDPHIVKAGLRIEHALSLNKTGTTETIVFSALTTRKTFSGPPQNTRGFIRLQRGAEGLLVPHSYGREHCDREEVHVEDVRGLELFVKTYPFVWPHFKSVFT